MNEVHVSVDNSTATKVLWVRHSVRVLRNIKELDVRLSVCGVQGQAVMGL